MEEKNKKLADIRKEYQRKELDKSHVDQDPLKQLQSWINDALEAAVPEPTAMVLSTVSEENKPSSRVLLLKGLADEGLLFFTNYESKKGREIQANPFAAVNFFWPELERQVRVEGHIEKLSEKDSRAYFHSRPRGSQIGALVSPQSSVIAGRDVLLKRKEELEKKYEGREIPKPENWGGYCLIPDYFEFWQGRPNRLHDRICFKRENGSWKIERLAP